MRWPWSTRQASVDNSKRESREAAPFTDALVSVLQSLATGTATGDPAALGALETAAGLYARAFASATVTPDTPATRAVTPAILALIARELIRRGESVHAITVRRGMVRLAPIGSWDVRGGPDEAAWWYRCDHFGPSGNFTRLVRSAAVVHCRYAVDPARTWCGISPLGWSRSTATLAANLELRLGQEAGAPVGSVIPVPARPKTGEDDDPLAALREDLANLKGKAALVETTAGGFDQGPGAAPRHDWRQERIGGNPPESLASLRSQAALSVLAACGIPPSLAVDRSDGTAQREAWRRFLHGSVAPLAKLVARELAAKLEVPDFSLGFDDLFASDLSGRARAFQSMVGAGMDVAKAAALAGLMEDAA